MAKRFRLAVVNSHPIQYFAPLFRRIAESPDIDITVYYCSKQGLQTGFVDPGFGVEVVWDVPLLEGYNYKILPNLFGDHGVRGFFSPINPSIIPELKRGQFDAVVIHGHNLATNLIALIAAKSFGTSVFMRSETHLLLKRHAFKALFRPSVMKLFYRLCDACLYIGTRNKEFYLAHGVPDQKLFFVPYTVDNHSFEVAAESAVAQSSEIRRQMGIPLGIPIILYASKLIPRKRPRDLLLAHTSLAGLGVQAALIFVGTGEALSQLQEEVASRSLALVFFAGFVNQSQLPAYYCMADVFVLPSEDEPWGLVVNEVMSCGVPVVTTTEVGAAADLVLDGQTGFTYQAGEISSLTTALGRILTNVELRRSMGQNCRARMRQWSYGEAITGILEALATTRQTRA